MSKVRIFSVVLLAVMLLTACKPGGSAEVVKAEELKVAILSPLSGPVPTFGVSTRDGALLAIEEWNAKGGVLGMKIVPIVEDSQCTPDPAVNAANKVIDQDKVHYIIGEVCSKASIPVSEIANAKGVLQISPTSTSELLTVDENGVTKEFVFRACFIDPFQGLVGAKFAMENLGSKTAFVMLDQSNDYVKGLAESFEKAFTEAGGTVVGKASYTAKDTDFSAIIAQIKETNPEVVYLPDYYNIVNLVMKQAKEAGVNVPFVGGDGWDSADLDLAAAAGGFFTNHYSPDSTAEAVVSFKAAYGAKYKDDAGNPLVPDALAALAYDATNLLFSSIEAAGVDDAAKVKDAMAGITFEAVSGTITFDAQHNPVKAATILSVTEDGVKFEAVVQP